MSTLQDETHDREGAIGVRKGQGATGRGGDGNARKSASSANGTDATTSMSVASRFLGSLSSRGATTSSDRSTRTRRWSSASDKFTSVTNVTQEVGDSDLYTISSRSTGTMESGVLSDIPSFISEYTFKTSSNSGSKSRPSILSSSASQRSVQSDWPGIRRTYSSESLPETISEGGEATGIIGTAETLPVSNDPLSSSTPRSLIRRRRNIAPFDETYASGDAQQQPQTAGSRSPRKFRMFRKASPSIESQLSPPPTYPRSRPGRSRESLDIRGVAPSISNSAITRRNSNPVNRQVLLRVGSHGDNFIHLLPVQRPTAHPSSQTSSIRE